jgi:putative phosphoesterase
MRIAIISDIHGNLVALKAVLEDISRQNVDKTVCLGDVAAFGPQPCETIKLLKDVGCPVVMGNTDAWLLNPEPMVERDADSRYVFEIENWAAEQLTSTDHDYLKSFQPTIRILLGDKKELLCYHGSPSSFNDVILASIPDHELTQMLSGSHAALMAGGHTHTPMLRRYEDMTLINPGSVGLPYEKELGSANVRNPAWAEYAVVDYLNSLLNLEFKRVRFDARQVVKAAFESGMPHANWWTQDWNID